MHATPGAVAPGRSPSPRRWRWAPGARLAQLWALATETGRAWSADEAQSRAAALAYYAVFSFAPTLMIALAIAGAVLGEEAARGELRLQLQEALGDSSARAVEKLIASSARPHRGLVATLVAMSVITVAATGAFVELQKALNVFWKAPPRRHTGGLAVFLKRRAISMAMVLALGALLLASVLASAALSAFGDLLPEHRVAVVRLANGAVSMGVITVLLATIFKYVPERRVGWKDVWAGALVTSLLFNLGKFAISALLTRRDLASAWGAAGAVVVLLAWAYYASMILFLGAELTQVFARRHGSLRGGLTPVGPADASRPQGL